MRELLFRGFHPCDGPDTIVVDGEKVKGRWVEGYIVKHPSAIQIGNDYSPWYIHVPPVDPDDNGGVFNVLPSTVGQYTGLKDKNEKRIWEGDRIEPQKDEFYKCIIKFSCGSYRMTSYGIRGAMMEYGCDEEAGGYGIIKDELLDSCTAKDAEVIGTVFDEVKDHDER